MSGSSLNAEGTSAFEQKQAGVLVKEQGRPGQLKQGWGRFLGCEVLQEVPGAPGGGHRLEDLGRDQKRPLMDAAGTCLALSPFSRACQAGLHCWQMR